MIRKHFLKIFLATLIGTIIFSGCTKSNQSQQQTGANVTTQSIQAYFTANEGGSVSKIDVLTNKVVDTIKIDGAAHNVQISPDGNTFAVTVIPGMANTGGNDQMPKMVGTVQIYDTKTDKLIKSVKVGNHPAHVVYTKDGNYLLVTNNQDNNVSVISAKDYKIIGTVPTGKEPHGFRISNDSKYAYIANMGEDTVSVIDIPNLKELKKIKVGKTPVTTGISNDGNTLVVTSNAEDALYIVDLATGKADKIAVGKGPAQVYLENDDKYAFVANQGTEQSPSNSVSKIHMSTKKVITNIITGNGAHGFVVSSDNKYVYVTNMYDNTVSVIDNNTNSVVNTVQVGKEPNGISYFK